MIGSIPTVLEWSDRADGGNAPGNSNDKNAKLGLRFVAADLQRTEFSNGTGNAIEKRTIQRTVAMRV
jgi:hypothetical protein